jgi:iron complex outermembrane receptor protein
MPTSTLSLFANRSTSFLPVQGTTAEGKPLNPETGTQYELGVKSALLDNRVIATIALFELTRSDVAVSDRDDPSALETIGEQRARGVELSVHGRVSDSWDIYAAYGYTDAETTEDTISSRVGQRIRNVPQNTFALTSDYGITSAIDIGAAVNYEFTLPHYWRTDLYGSYKFDDHWKMRIAVENIFDKTYYSHAFSYFEIWPGAPRTVKVQLSTRF